MSPGSEATYRIRDCAFDLDVRRPGHTLTEREADHAGIEQRALASLLESRKPPLNRLPSYDLSPFSVVFQYL